MNKHKHVRLFNPPNSLGKDIVNLIDKPLTSFRGHIFYLEDEKQNEPMHIVAYNKISKQTVTGYMTIEIREGQRYRNAFFHLEEDVMIGLIKLSFNAGFTSPKVYFNSISELCKYVGWSRSGKSIAKMVDSLKTLKSVNIETNLYWNKTKQLYERRHFSILSDVVYDYMDASGNPIPGKKQSGFFVWSDTVFQDIDTGYIKGLDLDMWRKIKNPAARKLFRMLDKRFYKQDVVHWKVEYLANHVLRLENLGLWYYKRQITKYAQELKRCKFISEYYYAKHQNEEHIVFEKAGAQQDMFDIKPIELDVWNPDYDLTFESLRFYGISDKTAKVMLSMWSLQFVTMWVDCVTKGKALKLNRVEKPAAFLTNVIKKGPDAAPLPKQYIDYIEAKKKEKETREISAKKKTAINMCQYCNEYGERFVKYKVGFGKNIHMQKSKITCNHKPIQLLDGKTEVSTITEDEFFDFINQKTHTNTQGQGA